MRAYLQPPPARYPFGRTAGLGGALIALGLAGAGALGAWGVLGLGQEGRGMRGAGGALLWMGCLVLAWRWWRRLPSGTLVWDGNGWRIERGPTPREELLAQPPEVRLDLQRALLVQVRPVGGGACWLWLAAARDQVPADAWLAMRRALYSRALVAPAPADGDARTSNETPA